MLQATLGLINIEQNNIIKIFSVAAAIFLPPTLIASIYGMNFHFMPELDSHYGYPVALLLMVVLRDRSRTSISAAAAGSDRSQFCRVASYTERSV